MVVYGIRRCTTTTTNALDGGGLKTGNPIRAKACRMEPALVTRSEVCRPNELWGHDNTPTMSMGACWETSPSATPMSTSNLHNLSSYPRDNHTAMLTCSACVLMCKCIPPAKDTCAVSEGASPSIGGAPSWLSRGHSITSHLIALSYHRTSIALLEYCPYEPQGTSTRHF